MPAKKEARPMGLGFETLPFSRIDKPGVYIAETSGLVFRIREEALSPGSSPLLHIVGDETVVRVSENPRLTSVEIEDLALDNGIACTIGQPHRK